MRYHGLEKKLVFVFALAFALAMTVYAVHDLDLSALGHEKPYPELAGPEVPASDEGEGEPEAQGESNPEQDPEQEPEGGPEQEPDDEHENDPDGKPEENKSDPEPEINIVPKTEFARALKRGDIDSVLVLGDSISAGQGADDFVDPYDGRLLFTDYDGTSYYEPYPTNGGWVNGLRDYLGRAGVDEFVNASICGSSLWWLLGRFDLWAKDGADAIVVMLGTNDTLKYSGKTFYYVCSLALKELSNRCDYLLVILPPDNERIDLNAVFDIELADRIIEMVCEENGIECVSAYDAIEPGTSDYRWDQVHPTSSGHQKLWDYIAAEIGLE